MHQVQLLIGSNIDPQQNIQAALKMLESIHPFKACSRIWKTLAYENAGPDFLNIAISIETPLSMKEYKESVISSIETNLKRQRFPDKNAPRTMDIDIIIFDGQVVDSGLWNKFFITVPLADLLPKIKDPDSGKTLQQLAQGMLDQGLAVLYANRLDA
jgi:2-amino-4-hydroxy-6-hydroxymethyldihydropteridine diphosphokinase